MLFTAIIIIINEWMNEFFFYCSLKYLVRYMLVYVSKCYLFNFFNKNVKQIFLLTILFFILNI